MPVPLPPASVGLVFFPHPSHVHQSVHSTRLTHSGLAHGPGLGLSCPTHDQPVKSGYEVGKVLLLLTNVDYPAPKATGSPDSSQKGEDLGQRHEPPPGKPAFSFQLQTHSSLVSQEIFGISSHPRSWLNSGGQRTRMGLNGHAS